MSYVRACSVEDVPLNGLKRVKVNDQSVVVYHLADGFFATQSSCSHTLGPLGRGKVVDGARVRCPLHHAEFDIKTGGVTQWACFPPGVQLLNFLRGPKPIKTYPTRVENGAVLVDA